MSNMQYKAPLEIFVHHPVPGGTETKIESLHYDVHSFEVDGGAVRKINLDSTDEPTINSELEQARTYKNITLYMKSGKRASTAKLIELFKSSVKSFNAYFYVNVYQKSEAKLLRVTNLIAKSSFLEAPIPVGDTPPALKIRLNLDSIELYRGVYKQGKLEFE